MSDLTFFVEFAGSIVVVALPVVVLLRLVAANGASGITIRSNDGAGGSSLMGGTNTSLISLGGKLGYRVSPTFDLFLSARQSVWGQAAPNGLVIAAGIQVETSPSPRFQPFDSLPNNMGILIKGFVSYSSKPKF